MSTYCVGDQVIIRKDPHSPYICSWITFMDKYDGKVAIITHCVLSNTYLYELDVDGSTYWWHEDFLLPAPIMTKPFAGFQITAQPTVREDGTKCSKCGDFVPYATSSTNFVCYGCRH